ncbi:MAG TPA: ABC transporter permease [Thermoanaerobaculia bacterium]|nr:ABC transporter permease [Thermoanaerobaculia bacterium]
MNWFAQISALTGFNLRTLPQRKGSAAAAAAGIAGVVAVLVGVLSIGQGFREAMTVNGSEDTAIVLRTGADTEMTSILMRDSIDIIEDAPGTIRNEGKALVSPELFVIINLPKKTTGTDANIAMRGVEAAAFGVRPEVKIVEGRMFGWGRNEVIVGRGAQLEFRGLDSGSVLELGQSGWTVVGIFEAGGGLVESEIWADATVLAPAYRRGSSYQVAIARLASAGSFQTFKDALTADPRLNVKVVRESEFYAEQSQLIYLLITGLGTLIATLMALGAVFGALNTMYTAVASRAKEIATLKALGFGASPVVVSILIESLFLAAVGGAIGAGLAWLAFDGYRAATMNWQSFSQIAFAFQVDGRLLLNGILYAMLIGFFGGLFPAIRAARMPVAAALREG